MTDEERFQEERFCECGCGGKAKSRFLRGHNSHRTRSVEERLPDFIRKLESGCWEWIGSITRGYGQFGIKRKTLRAHKYNYESKYGKVPEGLVLDHTCRNKWCVNPDHLQPVKQIANMETKNMNTHWTGICKRGHLLVGDNVRMRSDGRQQCKTCQRASDARKPERKLAKMRAGI
jgi:hypothetical protein